MGEKVRWCAAEEQYAAARTVRGQYRDEVYRREGLGREVFLRRTDFKSNLIVATLPVLLAGLMANESTFRGGILFHALGEGLAGWDMALEKPSVDQVGLVNEFFRKIPDSITFLDDQGKATSRPTTTILVKTTFDYGDAGANGRFIREQGLFGGSATGAKDRGLMVNAINHPALWKDETIRLVRFIQLMF